MYNLAVNDVLQANMSGIEKLVKYYHEPSKKVLKMNDCMRMFIKDTESGLTEKDFYYCYGMSKMTVVKETNHHR